MHGSLGRRRRLAKQRRQELRAATQPATNPYWQSQAIWRADSDTPNGKTHIFGFDRSTEAVELDAAMEKLFDACVRTPVVTVVHPKPPTPPAPKLTGRERYLKRVKR